MSTNVDDDLPPDPELNDSIVDDLYHQPSAGPDAGSDATIGMTRAERPVVDIDSDDDARVVSARTRSVLVCIYACTSPSE